jgi:signal transduction histidine kinase
MDVNSQVNVRSTLSGAIDVSSISQFSPESEARKLLEIMGRSGVLPSDVINSILGESEIEDGEVIDVAETVSNGGGGEEVAIDRGEI